MSKTRSGTGKGDSSMKRWADSVSISDNHSQQGIELHFNVEPHPELQSKLRVKGFLPSKAQVMWYVKETPDSREFAQQVKNSFPVSPAGPELSLSPSYEPLRANIENKRFSYVLISLSDGQEKSYVVFEPSKPRAEVIAANFAWSEFGSLYKAIAVKPKGQVREVRMLFEEGRIIQDVEYKAMQRVKQNGKAELIPTEVEVKENQQPELDAAPAKEVKVIKETLSNDRLNPTMILNAFHKWLKVHPEHKDPQKVTKPVFLQWLEENYGTINLRSTEEIWDRHKRLIKIIKRLGNLDTKMIVAQPYSSIYNKLLKIIPGLMEHLDSGAHFSGKSKSGGHMDLHFDFLYKDKQGYIIALAHYYELNGDLVADPDMQIRIIPEMKMAEAMTFQDLYRYDEVYPEKDGKVYVDADMKKKLNAFLNQWLSNVIADGHQITLVKEGEDVDSDVQEITAGHSNGPSDITQINIGVVEPVSGVEYSTTKNIREQETDVYKLAFDRLKKLIPDLEEHLKGDKSQISLEYEFSGEEKVTTCFFTPASSTLFIVETVEGEKHMESDILIELDKQEARVTAEWLSDYYAEGLDRLDPDNELDGDDRAIGEDMTRGLTEWLEDLLNEGLTITPEPKTKLPKQPLSFLNEPLVDAGLTGELSFNPVAVTTCVRDNLVLTQSWRQTYRNDPLPVRNAYTEGEVRDLKVFYNTYILESSSEAESDYKAAIAGLNNPSFTVSDGRPKEREPLAFKKRNFSVTEEKKILEDFKKFGFKAPFTVKEAFDKKLFTMDVALRYQHTQKFFKETFDKPIKKRVAELQDEAHKYKHGSEKEKANRSEHWKIGVELLNAEKCYKDEFILFKDDFFDCILVQAKELGFYTKDSKDLQAFRQFIESAVFDEEVIQDYERKPITELTWELIADYFHSGVKSTADDQTKTTGVVPYDILRTGRFIPNVLVPTGTMEPFWSDDFYIYDMKEVVKNNFPHLRKLTSKTLSKATAIEMFELVQMSHPTDYGIKVDRQAMLQEWVKRGKELFLGLGYPVDPDYPYVNINTGYDTIETLNEILWDGNKEGDQWWSAAEKYRPIADLDKALDYIAREIESVKEAMHNCINPSTNKPKASQKDEYNRVKFNLGYYEKGKESIQNYLNKNKAKTDPSKQKKQNEPIEEEPDPVIKEHEKVEIPFLPSSKYSAEVRIAIAKDKTYRIGVSCSKIFGDSNGTGYAPSDQGDSFPDRNSALKAGLLRIKNQLKSDHKTRDIIFNNETEKQDRIERALKSLEKFAQENAITLNDNVVTINSTPIISDLEPAYWNQSDSEYPVDKATIKGQDYHQARLREALLGLIKKLPMERRLELAEDLSKRFTERRPMHEYMKDHLDGVGKFGKKTFTGAYYDDMIIDNDLKDDSGWPVCSYLISVLINKDEQLVDLPQKEKPKLKKVSKINQHELNRQIENLINDKDKKCASFTNEEKELISQYAGSGGLLKQGATGRGVLYEYYTPDEIVQRMWGLAQKFGYAGGSVLEPAVGIGNFLKYAPKDAVVFGFETSHYAARIAQILYPNAHIHEKAFESLFFAGNIHLKDKIDHPLYSLVIGNPPYGEFTGKYAGMGERKWTGALEYDQYFILRGLDLLVPGGLMVFIVPSQFLSNGHKYNKTKEKINAKAELLDAYRLPGRVFSTTDIGTDIIVFRKRGASIAASTAGSIDQEDLPMTKAKNSVRCSITGLFIETGDEIFYDLEKPTFIKAVKIVGGDNPAELTQNNPKLPSMLQKMFENYMLKNGERNELWEKYYGQDAIYDPAMAVDTALEYIYERMHDEGVSTCWLHKIDVTEAFAD